MDFFDTLPIMCQVNSLYLCVHGGISPELLEVADVNTKINRF
jgi:diadenosine tetraphosphatase ApaH/serine/threonine PP2A family protein phosphatase